MDEVGIGLVGLGTVGSGVARILLDNAEVISLRTGRRVRLAQVVDLDPTLADPLGLPRDLVSQDIGAILDNPDIRVVVQVIGGLSPAREIMLKLLAGGKSVVTANKALLATHGRELFKAARKHGQSIAMEASVAGGIPILKALQQGLVANRIESISAIVNGTANYVLTQMTRQGLAYDEALRQAQSLGYAEADPALDVDGTDSAHKLTILASLAFDADVPLDRIRKQGIRQITQEDIGYADELGYVIKLLATAACDGDSIELEVSPRLVSKDRPMALVGGPFNAISVIGDAVGHTMYYGQGAGQMPTGSAVVADVIDTIMGQAGLVFGASPLWSERSRTLPIKTPEQLESRFYLRFVVEDRPGVLAAIARTLGDHRISITSVLQHESDEPGNGKAVPVVITTHRAVQANVLAAVDEINGQPFVTAATLCLRVQD